MLEETLGKKGLTLDDIEIYINNTKTNPLPKNDKGLRVPTEPLGGLEVFILRKIIVVEVVRSSNGKL